MLGNATSKKNIWTIFTLNGFRHLLFYMNDAEKFITQPRRD